MAMAVSGLSELQKEFQELLEMFGEVGIIVGYDTPYALRVHEDLEIAHPMHGARNCGGQAKFLEEPARNMAHEIFGHVIAVFRKTGNIEEALESGAYMLQRASQELVPVLTGRLRSSAFVEKTEVDASDRVE